MTHDQTRNQSQAPGPGESPADLAGLQATDALLDRISAGTLSARDQHDPLIAAFAQLRGELDAPADDAGLDVARLMEVLGERPLYLVDTTEAGDGNELDSPITLGAPERTPSRVIDVRGETARSASGAHRPPAAVRRPALPAPAAQVAARVADATTAAYGGAVRSINSLTAGRRASHGRLGSELTGWQAVAERVALPAASVVLLLAVGSGVSAAVTGDPMAPVAGMSKVVQQLPGISDDVPQTRDVQASIMQAGQLADVEPSRAQALLDQAGVKVADLPEAQQSPLKEDIQAVQQKIDVAAPPTDDPKASASASASATAPPSTPPTAAPSTPVTPSSEAPAPSSAAPEPSSSAAAPNP